ncbi:MAG: hypothetical protein DYH08_14615, partial [Actinobacteria bacterium ATB1]|nr:hypothetical protein [Actinobacteria bacterium ATB1]
MTTTIEREGLQSKSKADLETIAKQIGVRVTSSMRKGDIVDAIMQHHSDSSPARPVEPARPVPARGGETPDRSDGGREPKMPEETVSTEAKSVGDARTAEGSSASSTDSEAQGAARGATTTASGGGATSAKSDESVPDRVGYGGESAAGSGSVQARGEGSGDGQEDGSDDDSSRSVRKVEAQGGSRRRRNRNRRTKQKAKPTQQVSNEPLRDDEGNVVERAGVLDVLPDGYGFIRTS